MPRWADLAQTASTRIPPDGLAARSGGANHKAACRLPPGHRKIPVDRHAEAAQAGIATCCQKTFGRAASQAVKKRAVRRD